LLKRKSRKKNLRELGGVHANKPPHGPSQANASVIPYITIPITLTC